MITLDVPQKDFVSAINSSFNRGHNAIIARAEVGFGKTVIASYLAREYEKQGLRVMFSVHRRALLTQTAKTFNKFDVYYGYIASDYPRDPFAPAQLASIDTLKNHYKRIEFKPDILFVDEAHLSLADGWMEVLSYYKKRGTKIIGLTATPDILSEKKFKDFYTDIVCSPSAKWLMENINPRTGNTYLSGYKLYVAQPPELENVGTRGDDFIKSKLSAWLRESTIVGDSAESWKAYAKGKRTIAFRASIEDSIQAVQQFNDMGIKSAHIDANTPDNERKRAINQLADGELDLLSNCDIMSEGFDLSAQVDRDVPIEAVILERPTLSYALHAQQVGRALRAKDHDAIILDHVGNTYRHGLPDAEYIWTLEGRQTKGTKIDLQDDRFENLRQVSKRGGGGGGGPRIINRVDGNLAEINQDDRNVIHDENEDESPAIRILRRIAERKGIENAEQWAKDEYAKNHACAS